LSGDTLETEIDVPAGLDIRRASNWDGAEYNSETGKLEVSTDMVDNGCKYITHNYDLGNGATETFALMFKASHSIENGTCTVCGNQFVAINETNFPDDTFRKYVSDEFDTDGDGVLSTDEIAAVTYIDVSDNDYEGEITSLK
jgi:hypothetical protein